MFRPAGLSEREIAELLDALADTHHVYYDAAGVLHVRRRRPPEYHFIVKRVE